MATVFLLGHGSVLTAEEQATYRAAEKTINHLQRVALSRWSPQVDPSTPIRKATT